MMPTRAQVTSGKPLANITRDREAENLRKQLKIFPWLRADKAKYIKDLVVSASGTTTHQHGLGYTPDRIRLCC
jgi:hypothetical protein